MIYGLTPEGHEDGEKNCGRIVEQIGQSCEETRVGEFDVGTGLVAQRTQSYVTWKNSKTTLYQI